MPNHLHVILYFPEAGFNLNKIISNAKRFMPASRTGRAYEIIKRLQQMQKQDILKYLAAEVSGREKKKGQLRKVFIDSPACLQAGLMQKLFIMKSFLTKS